MIFFLFYLQKITFLFFFSPDFENTLLFKGGTGFKASLKKGGTGFKAPFKNRGTGFKASFKKMGTGFKAEFKVPLFKGDLGGSNLSVGECHDRRRTTKTPNLSSRIRQT